MAEKFNNKFIVNMDTPTSEKEDVQLLVSSPLYPYLVETERCINYISARKASNEKKARGFRIAVYVLLCISLALDFAPAFITVLQSATVYPVATVSFSLACLIFDIYRDTAEYELTSVRDGSTIEKFNSVKSSLMRKIEGRGTINDDYSKRMSEKISLLKLGANIPEASA